MERRLAAILAADVVGYSRLMSTNEVETLSALQSHRDALIEPTIAAHRGRVVKWMGDGVLAEFASAVDAVAGAANIQRGMWLRNKGIAAESRIVFRIGINVGDIIVEGDDIHGDGVNVAARLEALAAPGGICLSAEVYRHVKQRLDLRFEDLGEREFKNISDPVRVYRVRPDAPAGVTGSFDAVARRPPTLAHKPPIAVLPFRNLSPDPDQDYFVDGMTEDIITSLSNWRSFPVFSRHSTLALQGMGYSDKQICERLGARYVVQGSVRRSGDKLRITAELTDAHTNQSLWSQRYDRKVNDIFEVQDDVAFHIAAAVAPEICRTEYQTALRKNPDDLNAWDIYLHAVWQRNLRTKDGVSKAKKYLEKLVHDGADFPEPYSLLALILSDEIVTFAARNVDSTINRIFQLAGYAHRLNVNDPAAYISRAIAHFWKGELHNAVSDAGLAVQANPSSPLANAWLGLALTHVGEAASAEAYARAALTLSPLDPDRVLFLTNLTLCLLGQHRFEEALNVCEDALSLAPNLGTLRGLHVVVLGHLDRQPLASEALQRYLKIRNIENEDDYRRIFVRNSVLTDLNLEGLRKAGWSG